MQTIHHSNSTKSSAKYLTLHLILLGFVLLNLETFFGLPNIIQKFVGLIGFVLILVPFLVSKKKYHPFDGGIKIIFNIFLVWSVLIVIRPFIYGELLTYRSISPFEKYGVYSYLVPFIVFLGINKFSFKKIFYFSVIFAVIGIIQVLLNLNRFDEAIYNTGHGWFSEDSLNSARLGEFFFNWFTVPVLAFLCQTFLNKKEKLIIILGNLVYLFIAVYLARRSTIAMVLIYFIFVFYLHLNGARRSRKFTRYIFISLIIVVGFFIFSMFSDSLFSFLVDRINEDTRSGVDAVILVHLIKDNNWIFGNGVDASYDLFVMGGWISRYTHETGYLYMLMKGGIIYLILYLLIMFHSAFIGFFKSNNILLKGLALYIFGHIIYLIPFGLPQFSAEYVFLWISVLFCQSAYWRGINNNTVRELLGN